MTEKMLLKRKKLRKISDTAKAIHQDIQDESVITVNDMIMTYIYNPKGNLIFRSFKKWKKEGYTVKKGSKAFLLWGQPLNANKDKEQEQAKENETDEDENDFFPVAYVFSSEQVKKAKSQKADN